jgi:zinc protease
VKRLLAIALLTSACGGAPRATDTTTQAQGTDEVRVVTLPASQTPAVTLRLAFRAGAADDPPGREGLTALAARLMAEGGTQALGSYELKQALFPWAAELGVEGDKEMTVFVARVHRDHLDEFLPLLGDVLLRPRWDAKEFERLRRDAVDDVEKNLRGNDDERLGKEALQLMLYAGHPYGHPDVGTVEGLRAATLEDAKAQAAKVFTRERLTIGVAGGWPEDLPAKLSRTLAALPSGAAPAAIPAAKGMEGARLLLVEKDAPAVAVSMGAPVAFDRADPDFPALMVAVSAFGEHRQFHGRLMQRLRELRGLNYGDYAYAEHFEQEGWSTFARVNIPRSEQYFSIWLRPVQPAQAHFALRLALREYEKLLNEGLTDEEVATVKSFLGGYTQLWEKNDSRRLGYAIDDAFYGTPERLKKFREALPSITTAQVNAALKKHLPPADALRIAVVTADAAKFQEKVLNNEATPIEYTSPKPQAILDEDVQIMKHPFGIEAAEVRVVPAAQIFQR